jgi:carotenoid 1,2-hydratase
MSATKKTAQGNTNFSFCSSIADDVWHPSEESSAYEWWYFDAVSDDGRDALTVIFLDNFIFSPRYNKFCAQTEKNQESKTKTVFPAIAFCYYRDGKILYRAINEFNPEDFSARTDFPACQIGNNRFDFEATPYGVRYIVNIDAVLRGNQRLRASLEWLIIERDFQPVAPSVKAGHFWNLAAPRADVTGKIDVFNSAGKSQNHLQFRGTGYHDHNQDARWLPATVSEWQWGRAHFNDATAVFYRYCEKDSEAYSNNLFLIRENNFAASSAVCSEKAKRRNVFGLKYPRSLEFSAEKGVSFSVKQSRVIDASFFYLRFLSEMELDFGDGEKHQTVGITEHLSPGSLRWRFLDWLVNMRIGRNGRGSFLP